MRGKRGWIFAALRGMVFVWDLHMDVCCRWSEWCGRASRLASLGRPCDSKAISRPRAAARLEKVAKFF